MVQRVRGRPPTLQAASVSGSSAACGCGRASLLGPPSCEGPRGCRAEPGQGAGSTAEPLEPPVGRACGLPLQGKSGVGYKPVLEGVCTALPRRPSLDAQPVHRAGRPVRVSVSTESIIGVNPPLQLPLENGCSTSVTEVKGLGKLCPV